MKVHRKGGTKSFGRVISNLSNQYRSGASEKIENGEMDSLEKSLSNTKGAC